jgi:plasmid stabilization system protein ParE
MTRIIVSPQADADWDEILDRLAEQAGHATADRYAANLDAIYDNLTMSPAMGAPRPQYGRRTRIIVLSPYLVIYDHLTEIEIVHIVRILDGRRNITRRLVRQ